MNQSLVRAAACTLAAVAVTAVLLAVPASSPSQAATVTIDDSSCSGFSWNAATNTLSCTGGGAGGGGAISCSIALSNGSPTVSTAETLTANCSGATGTVTYTWTAAAGNVGCPGITQEASPNQNKGDVAAPNGNTALNCTYNLSASDSGTNTTSTPTKTINYTTGGGGGGGGGGAGWNGSCANVAGATHVINATWGVSQLYYSANAGGFGPNDAIVVKFTTSNVTASTAKGYVQMVEYNAPPTPRNGSLSDTPCDFTTGLPMVSGGTSVFANDNAPWVYFSLHNAKTGAATLNNSQTYYFNIMNSPGTCSGSCDILITFNKPAGT